jgi:3-methyl-2-oxobutanoate hydroxymethyltransferase
LTRDTPDHDARSTVASTGRASRLSVRDIARLRRDGEPIAMLTAYDFVTASLLDRAGVDLILVGDSVANVVYGHETTLSATLDDVVRHGGAVVRATARSLVVCDMPFGTYFDISSALRNAARILQETGCQAVKLEGGKRVAPIVEALTENGIATMGHIGLVPQSVNQLGGYFIHGRSEDADAQLKEDALALEAAGAFAIVLECIHPPVAAQLTQALTVPTIGIGSGDSVGGQVLVINDVLGLFVSPPPSFAKPRTDLAGIIGKAASEYVREVKAMPYPLSAPSGDPQ